MFSVFWSLIVIISIGSLIELCFIILILNDGFITIISIITFYHYDFVIIFVLIMSIIVQIIVIIVIILIIIIILTIGNIIVIVFIIVIIFIITVKPYSY